MAEENVSPISAAKPPVANPMASATSVHASTLKLKPVIRKPVAGTATARPTLPRPPVAPAAPAAAPASSSVEQLKGVTQKLKGITQQIPQQAILHKTGIIADQNMTEAQKQASKSRTARISLSDAIGVAPVKSEAAPMKTIRIRRPVDIQNPSGSQLKPPARPAQEAAPAEEAPADASKAAEPTASVTQRKTLKIARPGGGVRPTGKFGVKKPGATATPTSKAEGEGAPAEGEASEVQDIPDINATPAAMRDRFAAAAVPADRIPDVGKGWQVFNLIIQIAACIAMGFLGWTFWQDVQMMYAF